jgi:hypothetical protein
MIIAYRGYLHEVDETAVSIQRTSKVNRFGITISETERWSLTGMLFGDTPTLVTAAVAALEGAYDVEGGDLLLLDNNGTTVHRALTSFGSLGGVRVVSRGYPIGTGAEYTTYRTYAIQAEVEYPATGVEAQILDWQETLTIGGGAPRWVIREPLNGDPIKQQTHQRTKYVATQSGHAVGRFAWPDPAPPIWLNDLHADRPMLTYSDAPIMGVGVGRVATEWSVAWHYEFEAVSQLNGKPTQRPF